MSKKVAIVTGASRGIGAATARLLGSEGYLVVVNYRNQTQAADRVVNEIQRDGGDAFAIRADISQESDIMEMFQRVDDRWGRLDALVNNAGILETQCRVEDLTLARLERVMKVNVIGSFLCCREAVKRMKAGSGIVNVSSVASRLGAAGEYVDYAASKGAMDSLTIGLAREVADRGIRVNAVRPGFIYTDIHADGGEPGRVDRVGPGLPLGRGGNPEEVAQAILWFLSEKSAFSTGDFLEVAGGK
jgi:NAD(P)-dependent dehydrogenase (short-subunit alcohol dehydrogenase family)